jgi:hypothetical protein
MPTEANRHDVQRLLARGAHLGQVIGGFQRATNRRTAGAAATSAKEKRLPSAGAAKGATG